LFYTVERQPVSGQFCCPCFTHFKGNQSLATSAVLTSDASKVVDSM